MRSKFLSSIVVVLALAAITACANNSNNTTKTITVTVSPTSQQIDAGGTQQFTATVTNTTNTAVTWSISPNTGSISSSGLYTAPNAVPSQTTVTVTATSQASATATGTAAVTLMADSVSVTPATANLLPGGTQQFSANVVNSVQTAVTWSLPTGAPGTISAAGLYTAPNPVTTPGPVTVTATLVSDTTQSGTATATLLQLTGLKVAPQGPTLAVGGTQPFTATGTFTNGTSTSTADWTANSTWSTSPTAVATIVGATATAASVGVATVTATDTPSGVSGNTAVNVTNMTMTNANLSGNYVFSWTHAGVRGQGFAGGVFTADGLGDITGGEADFNAPQGSATDLTITAGTGCGTASAAGSCYSVSADGRGTMTLVTAQGTDDFDFILSNDGPPSTKGKFILSDSTGIEVGTFQQQTATKLGSGTYAFLLGGMDGTLLSGSTTFQNPEVLAGQFTVASNAISAATLDVNDNGTIDGVASGNANSSPALPFAATSTTADALGRGTAQVTPPSVLSSQLLTGSTAWGFAYYVVSASKILLIQTDVQATPPTVSALAGMAEVQSFATTDVSSSSYVFLLERSAAAGLFGAAGQWTFGSGTTLTGEMDINKLGKTVNVPTFSSSAAYTIASSGRGIVQPQATGSPSLTSAIVYLVSSSKMYVLETDVKANGGVAKLQSPAPLTLLTGTLSFGFGQLATGGNDASYSGQLVSPSGATVTGIVDSNTAMPSGSGVVESQATTALSGAYSSSVDLFGRGSIQLSTLAGQTNTWYGFYLVSPTEMFAFGEPATAPTGQYQAVDGVVDVQ
jgi:hypothetical protein